MRRTLTLILVGMAMLPLLACGDQKSKTCETPKSQPSASPRPTTAPSASGDTQLGLFKEMLGVFKSIKDETSAAAAKPKLDAIKERMGKIAGEAQELQMELDQEYRRIESEPELAVAAGLMPSLEEQEKRVEDNLAMRQQYLDILKSIQDEKSAKDAQGKIQSLMMGSQIMQMKYRQMPPPTPAQQEKIKAKFGEKQQAIMDALTAENKRLDDNPELMKALREQPEPAPTAAPALKPAPAPTPAP